MSDSPIPTRPPARRDWQAIGVAVGIAMAAVALAQNWGSAQAELRHLTADQQRVGDRVDRLEEADRRFADLAAGWRADMADLRAELRAVREMLREPAARGGRAAP